MVNVSDVFKFVRPLHKDSLPYINNRHYLNSLARRSACEDCLSVMIVVGLKDSGKLEGMKKMIKLWKGAGNFVLDLNLKGRPQFISGNDAMSILSRDLVQQLQFLDYHAYFNIHECMASVCWKELTLLNRIIKHLLSNLYYRIAGNFQRV